MIAGSAGFFSSRALLQNANNFADGGKAEGVYNVSMGDYAVRKINNAGIEISRAEQLLRGGGAPDDGWSRGARKIENCKAAGLFLPVDLHRYVSRNLPGLSFGPRKNFSLNSADSRSADCVIIHWPRYLPYRF